MFKKLEVAVPEVRFQFYSFQPDARYEEQFLPESWVDQTQVEDWSQFLTPKWTVLNSEWIRSG
jgi:hypothetical protein